MHLIFVLDLLSPFSVLVATLLFTDFATTVLPPAFSPEVPVHVDFYLSSGPRSVSRAPSTPQTRVARLATAGPPGRATASWPL